MTNQPVKKASPYPLRLDAELKQLAEKRARQNGRSMNSEIVQILKEVLIGKAEQAVFIGGNHDGYELRSNP